MREVKKTKRVRDVREATVVSEAWRRSTDRWWVLCFMLGSVWSKVGLGAVLEL